MKAVLLVTLLAVATLASFLGLFMHRDGELRAGVTGVVVIGLLALTDWLRRLTSAPPD